ncbi:uncharacterized protein LOC116200294 [Punica granatum]|uniref:Uncharacterized protein n=2 Tax=Punica granatum TaxID=22663 RepID=A0A2I0I2I4_PUNGR|nr:uncharacterized protein LOC116200294 [Punica granatum]PKI38172.1 hypothetical protein CRG98_041425 [Punica granatum]
MVRGLSLSQSALIRLPNRHRVLSPPPLSPSVLAVHARSHSSSSSPPSDLGDSPDPLLRKLEDVIHHIIVRRSEPEWLPFRPGSSYWVPPRSKSRGIAQLIGKLATGSPHLNADESMSTTTPRGWPSSSYFIHGISPAPRPVEAEKTSDEASQSEDEEE